jgi:signal transduction histidine kinase
VRWRLYVAGALHRLAAGIPRHAAPADVRAALARAFGDPELELVYWLEDGEGRWGDERGRPVTPPPPDAGRWLTVVSDGGRKVAGIIHDAALREEPAFVATATSYAAISLDNHRLAAQTASLLEAVGASRARIQATADEERRLIEQELHDVAQQRLAALRIRLQITADEMDSGGREGDPELLRELGADVDSALDEIHSLARGIYPAPLERGLEEALRSAALGGPLPTTVLAAGVGRYPREVEAAAYFCCLEALQNAAKHAAGATAVVVDLSAGDGVLRMEVRDDGAGYDPRQVTEGVGLVSMRDRLAAVGGELVVESAPGHGTRVRATIPI